MLWWIIKVLLLFEFNFKYQIVFLTFMFEFFCIFNFNQLDQSNQTKFNDLRGGLDMFIWLGWINFFSQLNQ